MVHAEYRRMRSLMQELGIPMAPRPLSPVQATVLPGDRLWRSRLDSPWSFLRHPQVPWAQKWRTALALARGMQTLHRHRMPADLYHPEAASPVDDESLRSWGDRAIGPEAVDHYLSLPTSTLFFWTADETPWWYTVGLARQAMRWEATVPAGGMGAVPRALARQLEVHCRHAVERLDCEPEGTVRLGIATPAGQLTWQVDGVIVALPAPEALGLMGDPEALLGPERAAYLRATRYVANLTTAIGYRHRVEPRAYGLGVPLALGHPLAAISWEHAKGADRTPPGAGLAVVMPTHAYSLEHQDQDEAALGSALIDQVARYYPGSAAAATFSQVGRWRHAMPLFPPGRARELARALAQPAPHPVVACGDAWMGPCTEQALATGQRAAAELHARLA